MAQARTVTNELKLGNLVHILYGLNNYQYADGVKSIGPLLKENVENNTNYHDCQVYFLADHLWSDLVDDYLYYPPKDGMRKVNSQLRADIYGRPQNRDLMHSGGRTFQKQIINRLKNGEMQSLVSHIKDTLIGVEFVSFESGIREFLSKLPEAEAGEMNEKYHINTSVLRDFILFIERLFTTSSQGEDGYVEVIAWLIIGCILRERLSEIQDILRCEYIEVPIADKTLDGQNCDNRFYNMIDSLENPDDTIYQGFYYKNPEFSCWGRHDEISLLNQFITDEKKVSWLAVTGESGVGKSKLLFDYVRSENHPFPKEAWKMVMVDSDYVLSFLECKSWNYPKNLLIVFDYAGENANDIGRWLFNLQSTEINNKIRIVLLERDSIIRDNEVFADPAWFSELQGKHDQKRAIETLRFDVNSDYKTLRLIGVDESIGIEIIKEYISNHDKENYNNYDYMTIYRAAQDIDSAANYPRPVIILFTTDAFIKNKESRKWDIDQLTEYIKEKIIEYWKNGIFKEDPNNLFDEMSKLLLYATCIGRLDIEEENDMNPYFETARQIFVNLPDERKEQILQSMNICNQSPFFLDPLEPDLIGEKYILDAFLKLHYKGKVGTIADDLLNRYPNTFSRCLMRCISDYFLIKRYKVLFENAMSAWNINIDNISEESALAWTRVLLQLGYFTDETGTLECRRAIERLAKKNNFDYMDMFVKSILD